MNALPLHELWEKLFPQERRWLSWLIILVLVLHLAAFALLRIRQAAPLTSKAPLLQTTALTALSSGPDKMSAATVAGDLVWLDWRDPSAPILPRGPLPALPSGILPGEMSGLSKPLASGSSVVSVAAKLNTELPSIVQQVQGSLFAFRPTPKEVQIETPPQLSGTVVEISGDLSGRAVVKKTDLPQPEVDRNLRVTICQLAVNAGGMVENVLVDSSCDDPAIDQLAVQELKNWQFAPGSGLQWGKAIVYWHFKGKSASPAAENNP
jgi:hypothetical protein